MTCGKYLRPIDGAESLLIPATNDIRSISERKDLFTGWVDPKFKNWKLEVKQVPTVSTNVQVLEQIKNGRFADIYTIPNRSLDSLCVTQPQITLFVEKQKEWLRTDGYGTFFLFKKEIEDETSFFVAHMYFVGVGKLDVIVSVEFSVLVWCAEGCPRFVIPQLPL